MLFVRFGFALQEIGSGFYTGPPLELRQAMNLWMKIISRKLCGQPVVVHTASQRMKILETKSKLQFCRSSSQPLRSNTKFGIGDEGAVGRRIEVSEIQLVENVEEVEPYVKRGGLTEKSEVRKSEAFNEAHIDRRIFRPEECVPAYAGRIQAGVVSIRGRTEVCAAADPYIAVRPWN